MNSAPCIGQNAGDKLDEYYILMSTYDALK